MTKLICSECAHENEPERIYCHNCGTRLDRSTVRVAKERSDDTRKRMRKFFDPQRARFRHLFFTFSKMILGACATAAVVQMILPLDVPPPIKVLILPLQINLELENAVTYHRPAQLQYTEEQVNAYFSSGLKTKQAALNKPLLDFNRAIVAFSEGSVTIIAERSLFGYPLYSSTSYAINLKDGKITASSKGGTLGRLPIHPEIMRVIGFIFADLWSVLDRERKLVAKMGAIEFHAQSVLLTAPAQ